MGITVIKANLECNTSLATDGEINSGITNGIEIEQDIFDDQLGKFAGLISEMVTSSNVDSSE